MYTLLVWVVCGWIAGAIALRVMPPKEEVAGWQTIVIGVLGSIVGGLGNAVITNEPYAPGGILMSILGAVAVVAAWRWYTEKP